MNRLRCASFKNVTYFFMLCSTLLGAQTVVGPRVADAPKLADIVQSASGSVALIETEVAFGTGFYVTADGWVITAKHVVTLSDGSPAKSISVEWTIPAAKIGSNGFLRGLRSGASARILKLDDEHDLALLSLDTNPFTSGRMTQNGQYADEPRHPAVLCNRESNLRSGEPVFTIGHPLGDFRKVTTHGIIASSAPTDFDSSGALRGTYLVDMLINHGNSGGPVFSAEGCVIGVADAISLRSLEVVSPDKRAVAGEPLVGVAGADGKPVLDQAGKPLQVILRDSSGLGILIPQQYVIKLLDAAGATSSRTVPRAD